MSIGKLVSNVIDCNDHSSKKSKKQYRRGRPMESIYIMLLASSISFSVTNVIDIYPQSWQLVS